MDNNIASKAERDKQLALHAIQMWDYYHIWLKMKETEHVRASYESYSSNNYEWSVSKLTQADSTHSSMKISNIHLMQN
jgi:hypothetical protein